MQRESKRRRIKSCEDETVWAILSNFPQKEEEVGFDSLIWQSQFFVSRFFFCENFNSCPPKEYVDSRDSANVILARLYLSIDVISMNTMIPRRRVPWRELAIFKLVETRSVETSFLWGICKCSLTHSLTHWSILAATFCYVKHFNMQQLILLSSMFQLMKRSLGVSSNRINRISNTATHQERSIKNKGKS